MRGGDQSLVVSYKLSNETFVGKEDVTHQTIHFHVIMVALQCVALPTSHKAHKKIYFFQPSEGLSEDLFCRWC